MKLGIGTYTYLWSIGVAGSEPEAPMSALDLLSKAVAFKLKVVQFGPNLPLDEVQPAVLDRLLDTAAAWGIELEMGTKGIDPAHLAGQVEFAARAGIRLLRTVPDYDKSAVPPSPRSLASALKPVIDALERGNVSLGIENASIPAAILAEALDRIGSPRVGVTLDTVNSLAIGEGAGYVAQTLARYTTCLHVKDYSVDRIWHSMGFSVEGRPAGQGQLDIPWLLDLLRSERRSPNAILELWPPRQSTVEETVALEQRWAEESIEYLRRLIPD
jgi:sugar phosphate isomerase/epimerase